MNNKKLFIILFLILFSSHVSAQDVCSPNGYTAIAINGIFVSEKDAVKNRDSLKDHLPPTYNNEKVTVDYLYNSTHLAGAGDLVDVVKQGFFNSKSDFDLVEMLDDASAKVKTQKLLLVGHSQGNFYANNFYDKVTDKIGGVPASSIGVYSVATPADNVAGGGGYLTSDSDNVIATLVGSVKNIMKPNTHIDIKDKSSNGHNFSDVYMKYRGDKIVSDIKSSFGKLSVNKIQNTQSPCISPQKISISRSVNNVMVKSADFIVDTVVGAGSFIYRSVASTVKSIAGLFGGKNLAQVGAFDNQNESEQVTSSENVAVDQNIPTEVVGNDNKGESLSVEKTDEIKQDEAPIIISDPVNNPEIINATPEVPVVSDSGNNDGGGSSHSGGGGSSSSLESTPDTTSPVITLVGESIVTINIGDVYTDAGATALDNIDGAIVVVTTGAVDVATVGTYTLTYTATDTAGNIGTLTRTINVKKEETEETNNSFIPDTTPPVITIIGENPITVSLNANYTDVGATALDIKDGTIDVFTTGIVDTLNIGKYIITYTATDAAGNIGKNTREVTVVNNSPIISTVATLSIPNIGDFASDGLNPNRGRKNLTPFVFNIIYTDSNNNPPQNIKLHIKNTTNGISLPEITMNHVSQGADILNDGNYVNGELYESTNEYDQGDYSYYFIASDRNGNTAKIEENNNLRFSSIASNYTYIPKSSFGINNGDGKDWQVWSFNGSNIYDWSDSYVNNYLREQFKIQAYSGGFWCSQCLQRGVFNHDPQKGFETSDLVISNLEDNPQNKGNGKTYDVVIQWDSTGYTYNIYQGSVIEATGDTNIANMNNNLWVGWDGSYNNFQTFPSGNWQDSIYASPMERSGGSDMMLKPYPVYNSDPNYNSVPVVPPPPVLSSLKSISSFDFESLTPKVSGVINETNHTVNLTVPYGTVITSLVPKIVTSEKSSILPGNSIAQDFTNPVTYTVKAEDGSTLAYLVTVVISPNPNPVIVDDGTLPKIESYTLNGSQNSITTNPLINNISIVLNSNKKVDWMSVKIEKEDNKSIYRMFKAGDDCANETNVCMKVWDGLLSSGELIQTGNYNGVYKIRVHIRDSANREYEDYLPSIITINLPKEEPSE